jgi:Zn finger protein HypA/HybF involved in hydrogenase expression
MGFSTGWRCEECGFELCISGLWEFYRDEMGLRRAYGHPIASSSEAVESGIKGFTTDAYCPECRDIRSVVVSEFEKPKSRALEAWKYIKGYEYKALCDRCGTPLKYRIEESNVCPNCNKGHFKISHRYIS